MQIAKPEIITTGSTIDAKTGRVSIKCLYSIFPHGKPAKKPSISTHAYLQRLLTETKSYILVFIPNIGGWLGVGEGE